MKEPLEIDIFFHTNETSNLDELEIDYDINDAELRKMIFYNINAISPYYGDNNDVNYTTIHSNGSQFITPFPIIQVRKMIYERTS